MNLYLQFFNEYVFTIFYKYLNFKMYLQFLLIILHFLFIYNLNMYHSLCTFFLTSLKYDISIEKRQIDTYKYIIIYSLCQWYILFNLKLTKYS